MILSDVIYSNRKTINMTNVMIKRMMMMIMMMMMMMKINMKNMMSLS